MYHCSLHAKSEQSETMVKFRIQHEMMATNNGIQLFKSTWGFNNLLHKLNRLSNGVCMKHFIHTATYVHVCIRM